MCSFDAPDPPTPAQLQAQVAPKDAYDDKGGLGKKRRRGLWAAVMTGPAGIAAMPTVTGSTGGMTGG